MISVLDGLERLLEKQAAKRIKLEEKYADKKRKEEAWIKEEEKKWSIFQKQKVNSAYGIQNIK